MVQISILENSGQEVKQHKVVCFRCGRTTKRHLVVGGNVYGLTCVKYLFDDIKELKRGNKNV